MQVICPTWQVFSWPAFSWPVFPGQLFPASYFFGGVATAQWIYERLSLHSTQTIVLQGERLMYFVTAVLAVLTGLFYAAGNNELGSLGARMCEYGGTFCDHPSYVLAGAILAGLWATFVSIR
jgi:hypothetical protein